jgi:hypothetical protein
VLCIAVRFAPGAMQFEVPEDVEIYTDRDARVEVEVI